MARAGVIRAAILISTSFSPVACFSPVVCSSLAVICSLAVVLPGSVAAQEAPAVVDVVVVVGAPGLPEYDETHRQAAKAWTDTCERADLVSSIIGQQATDQSDKATIQQLLETQSDSESSSPLWIVLIGHGTWNGATANFNLAGPDVSAKELDQWLSSVSRPTIVINGASCSSPFIDRLSGPDRVIVTATRSGSEQNYTRFRETIASAFGDPAADLNHDEAVSVREAFIKAVAETEAFYRSQGRLVSEHALLDDNGDRRGSSAELLTGKQTPKGDEVIDGDLAATFTIPLGDAPQKLSAEQIETRDQLERQLDELKQRFAAPAERDQLREAAFPILLQLSQLYVDQLQAEAPPTTTSSGGR
jgi:hypothetical protein